MKKVFFNFLLSLTLSNSAFALLPPFWEDVSELKAILADERLKDYFDSADRIESISKVPDGYLFTTNRSQIEAEVHYLPQSRPGPAKYEIHFHRKN